MQAYKFLKKLGRGIAEMIMIMAAPDSGIFSKNILHVKWAIKWGASSVKIRLAFKEAVVEKRMDLIECMNCVVPADEYFMIYYGCKLKTYNKQLVKETAIKNKNFNVLMEICSGIKSFLICFNRSPKLIKIAAEVKKIRWEKILNKNLLGNLCKDSMNFLLQANRNSELFKKASTYAVNRKFTKVLLKYFTFTFAEDDRQIFKKNAWWAYIAVKFKLFADLRPFWKRVLVGYDKEIEVDNTVLLKAKQCKQILKNHNIPADNFEWGLTEGFFNEVLCKLFKYVHRNINLVQILIQHRFVDIRAELEGIKNLNLCYESTKYYLPYLHPEKHLKHFTKFSILYLGVQKKLPPASWEENFSKESDPELWRLTF